MTGAFACQGMVVKFNNKVAATLNNWPFRHIDGRHR
jgi:hypothetical protein